MHVHIYISIYMYMFPYLYLYHLYLYVDIYPCAIAHTHTHTHTHAQQNTHKPTKRIAAPCDICRHTCPYSNTTRKAVNGTLDQRLFNEAALAARASL